MEKVKISQEEKNVSLINSGQVESLMKQVNVLKNENHVLKKENGALNARIKQIQSSMKMNKSQFGRDHYDESSEEEREFEVDQILDHRTNRSGRQFSIRWKGYGPSYDLWVNEENLNCPKILNDYLKKTNYSTFVIKIYR